MKLKERDAKVQDTNEEVKNASYRKLTFLQFQLKLVVLNDTQVIIRILDFAVLLIVFVVLL